MDRYQRNGIITIDEQSELKNKRVCVIGCGGLGGYVIEMLARFGVGNITVVDGDVFDETNLNRQLLCLMKSIGKSKAFTAKERIEAIDPDIMANVVATFIDKDNVLDIIKDHDAVIDALDSNETRLLLLEACREAKIPCVHGAIAGWFGQVSTVYPDDRLVRDYLITAKTRGVETKIGNPSFTPALIASLQASQTVKLLLNKGSLLREKLLLLDMLDDETEILEL